MTSRADTALRGVLSPLNERIGGIDRLASLGMLPVGLFRKQPLES
jgi:hypothetical protein